MFVRSGSSWSQQQKLVPSDGAEKDFFGAKVSVSGGTAIVGAYLDDDNGNYSGSAYIFTQFEDEPNGSPCIFSEQCASSACIDGVCCDMADCALSDCLACVQYRKADGSTDGTCGPVITGSHCGPAPGVCYSSTAYALAPTCSAAGECVANHPPCPDHFACVSNASSGLCATDCREDGSSSGMPDHSRCADDYWCDTDGTCVPDKAGGAECSDDEECLSKECVSAECRNTYGDSCSGDNECPGGVNCVDSVCCKSVCNQVCQACDIPGSLGTCIPVPANLDNGQPHHGSCAGAHADCGVGTCDGSSVDECVYDEGAPCGGSTTCDAGSLTSGQCAASGECVANLVTSCSPYVCADSTACRESCSTDNHCATGYYCDTDTDTCVEDRAEGEDCDADRECDSGFCADGTCCDERCNEQCEACDVSGSEGTCTAVEGDPHGSRPACGGTDPICGGRCDGEKRDGCSFPDASTSCGESSCASSVTQPRVCDRGSCVAGTEIICAPYGCNDEHTDCATSCTSNADCASGATCDTTAGECAFTDGVCIDLVTIELPNGSEQSCAPYICDSGECLRECLGNDECVEGYECDDGDCVEVETGSGGSGSGGAGGAEGEEPSGTGGLAEAGAPGNGGAPSGGGAEPGERGGSGDRDDAGDRGDSGDSSGCGCRTAGTQPSGGALWLVSLGLIGASYRRRRHGRKHSP